MKKKVDILKEAVGGVEKDILELKKMLDDRKAQKKELSDEEMDSLISKISLIEEKVDKNEYAIAELERIVDGKK